MKKDKVGRVSEHDPCTGGEDTFYVWGGLQLCVGVVENVVEVVCYILIVIKYRFG